MQLKAYLSSYDEGKLAINLLEDVAYQKTAQNVINDIDFWAAQSLELNVFSYGGSPHDAFAIYDYLNGFTGYSVTNIYGFCGSAMTIVACSTSKCYIGEHSFYFIHRAYRGNGKRDAETRMIDDAMVSVYVKKTGLDERTIRDMMRKETVLTAADAKRLGFVDGLLSESAIAAKYEYLSTNTMSDNQEAAKPETKEAEKSFLAKVASALGLNEAEETEVEDTEADEIVASLSEDLKAKSTAIDEMEGEVEVLKSERDSLIEAKAEYENEKTGLVKEVETLSARIEELETEVSEKQEIIAKLEKDPAVEPIKAEADTVQEPGKVVEKKSARKGETNKHLESYKRIVQERTNK